MSVISFSRDSLTDEIGNAAFVEADMREGVKDSHTLHQTYDVCSEDNRKRVNRLLDYAYAEGCRALRAVGNDISESGKRGSYRFRVISGIGSSSLLKVAFREFIVASVMWVWLRSTLPEAAECWRQRRDEAASHMMTAKRSGTGAGRFVSPL